MNKILSVCLIFFTLSQIALFASGGVSGGGVVNIPQGKDRDKYHLGKAVFQKELDFKETIPASQIKENEDRLEFLQGSLPNTEKRRTDLTELSGKITKEQLEALEYFLSVRFNIKIDKKDKQ